jgi:uncharacterized protein YndB with AHSA1/START domain
MLVPGNKTEVSSWHHQGVHLARKTKQSMTLPAHVADIHLRTTPAQLWAALTRPELTRRWYFRLAAESSWAVGTPVVYRDASGRPQVEGEVLEVVPGCMLVTSASFLFHP